MPKRSQTRVCTMGSWVRGRTAGCNRGCAAALPYLTQRQFLEGPMSEHYTIISADTHAGGSHEQYREYLDPQYRQAFDDWRGEYKNPWKDLRDTSLRVRNWDDDLR